MDETRTIGVMARAPVPNECKTRLASAVGAEFAADLCRAMLVDTLAGIAAAFSSSRLVVMAAPENDGVARLRAIAGSEWEIVPQSCEGLGARLAQSFRVLGRGGGAVALVDADSPTAPWARAAAALSRMKGPRQACMGPCEDGGYWLIALTAGFPPDALRDPGRGASGGPTVELGIFDGIAWSTPVVAEQTRARCRDLGLALTELPTSFDVDEPADLERLREDLRRDPSRAPTTARLLAAR